MTPFPIRTRDVERRTAGRGWRLQPSPRSRRRLIAWQRKRPPGRGRPATNAGWRMRSARRRPDAAAGTCRSRGRAPTKRRSSARIRCRSRRSRIRRSSKPRRPPACRSRPTPSTARRSMPAPSRSSKARRSMRSGTSRRSGAVGSEESVPGRRCGLLRRLQAAGCEAHAGLAAAQARHREDPAAGHDRGAARREAPRRQGPGDG